MSEHMLFDLNGIKALPSFLIVLKVFSRSYFGEGIGPIVLDELQCSGSEMSLFKCDHDGLFSHDCLHNEDAGVACSNSMSFQSCIQWNLSVPDTLGTVQYKEVPLFQILDHTHLEPP